MNTLNQLFLKAKLNMFMTNLINKTRCWFLIRIFILPSVVFLPGCAINPWTSCTDNQCIVDEFSKVGFDSLRSKKLLTSPQQIKPICEAFYQEAMYFDATRCIEEYRKVVNEYVGKYQEVDKNGKVQVGGPDRWEYITAITDLYLKEIKLFLDYGQYHKAYEKAQLGLTQLKQNFAIQMEHDYRELHRLAGISAAYLHNQDVSNRHIYDIRNIGVGLLNRTESDVANKQAMADIYIAQGNLYNAIRVLNSPNATSITDAAFFAFSIYSLKGPSVGGIPFFDHLGPLYYYNQLGDIPYSQRGPHKYRTAKISFKMGNTDEAKRIYSELLDDEQLRETHSSIYYSVLRDMANIYKSAGQLDKAREYYVEAIDEAEKYRANINVQASETIFILDKYNIYHELIELLIEQEDVELAFEYAERAKGRVLADQLSNKSTFGLRSKDADALLIKIRQLELQRGEKQRSGNELSVAKEELKDNFPDISSMVMAPEISLAKIKASLPDGSNLIYYFGFKDNLYVFLVNKRTMKVKKLEGSAIRVAVDSYLEKLSNFESDEYLVYSKQLYGLLITPVEGWIDSNNLIIVPHGKLNYLPFSALHDDHSFFVDRFSYSMIPNAVTIARLDSVSGFNKHALVIGNPKTNLSLPDLIMSNLEAEAISRSAANSKLLTGQHATETVFKENISQYGIIHFAGHAKFDPINPLNSSLILSKDDENDGYFTLSDIYDSELNAELVTLSACETGLGIIKSGEEIESFNRGFLYAGAKSVLSSLWKVSDEETGYLMMNFYERMRSMPKPIALQQAQLEIKNNINPHPYYWAAFQYTGI